MRAEFINGIFSIGAAVIAFAGGILTTTINNKKKERIEKIKELEEVVKQLAYEIICYSQVEDELVTELKTWVADSKKQIRMRYYEKLFKNGSQPLMSADKAQRILEKYSSE